VQTIENGARILPSCHHAWVRRNLVIARVGQQSLHEDWLQPESERNWDLYLSPYQPIDARAGLDCTVGEVLRGPKWTGLRQLLNSWHGWRDYECIWLPDDDIAADQQVISSVFDVAAPLGLQLFAPALDRRSYFAHFNTMQNTSFFGRRVGFVEIMVPAFTAAALAAVLPTLDHTPSGWGWGLDAVWPKVLGYEDIGIVDGLTVTHTRPVGTLRDTELFRRLVDECSAMTHYYTCEPVHTTFGAFGTDLEKLERTPEQLLVDLVRGWDYLFDRDPRQLAWVVEFQHRTFDLPVYPVGGTPT
jgi:hypothetical protein